MSFINSTTSVIRAKLTDTGRKLLSQGNLTYNYWVFGDSEIDYQFYNSEYSLSDNKVLSPKDKNYNIKYPIPSTSGADIFNVLSPIIPTESLIVNKASTRGFFTTGNTAILDRFKGNGNVPTSSLEGGNSLNIVISSGSVSVGDIVVIGVKNSTQSSSVNPAINLAIPYLSYKVVTTNGSGGTVNITVDRQLPNIDSGSGECSIFVIDGGDAINNYYGSGTTSSHWNYNTLSFENNCNCIPDDVPVWNFNIIYSEEIAGIDLQNYKGLAKYDSKIYNGVKEYLNYGSNDPSKKSIGVVHYTNNTISNYYGENLKSGTFKLTLPTIMWHNKGIASGSGTSGNMGLILTAQTTSQKLTSNSTLYGTAAIPFEAPYDTLVDPNGYSVGKVFTNQKIAIIEDEELLSAMSYKSNRNWTLPTINGNFVAAPTEAQGLLSTNEEAFVTYLLVNDSGTGYTTGLHCQNYKRVSRGGINQNNIRVNLPVNQLPFMKTSLGVDGGFTATKCFILVQKALVGKRPVSNSWKIIDVTSQLALSAGNIIPTSLESTNFVIDLATYNAAPTYNLHSHINIPTNSENDILNFGEEYVLFGNVDADITATTYKSLFMFPALSNQFKTSVNPTYNTINNDSVFISEVGIYNNFRELVAIGKLSEPIKKLPANNIIIQLEIDF